MIRVIYPQYAAGVQGRIQAREESGRWIVKLEENPINWSNEPILLSLDESDFEVIDPN
ncbi:MAG: hypothetical protein LDL41_08355 [Coleofasciculus sp. S288]|nr:hypothetical protein [Coleofasciculus sp. S288]